MHTKRPTEQTLRVAVIGAGKMGANHARVYNELPHCDLVGVYDVNPTVALNSAARLGCIAFPSLDALLTSGIDAVTIAVPTSLHAALTICALEAGLHVLVEKPIAATSAEAAQMIEVAHRYQRKLMVGHIERFNPAIQAIQAHVAPDEILAVNLMRVGPTPPRIKDAGVIIDLAVHDIDLVHFLVKQPVSDVYCVTSSCATLHEDTASILLRMEGGASAQITTNWITPYKAREIQVVTADRLIKGNLLTQQVQSFSRFSPDDLSYIVRDMFVQNQEPLRAELEAFLMAIREDQVPLITGEDGKRVLDVALRAYAYKQKTGAIAA